MPKYVVHTFTDYCGTDDTGIVTTATLDEAEKIASNLAHENALQYYDIVSEEVMTELENEGADTEDYITDDQFGFDVQEYDPAIHFEIDLYDEWN